MSNKPKISKEELKTKLLKVYEYNDKLTTRLINENEELPSYLYILKFIDGI